MVNQNAIDGLNYNDNADAIAACNAANAAEANSCSGIIYAPALGNWSARLYNVSNFREFPFPNVDWYSYNGTPGCDGSRRLRRQLVEDNPTDDIWTPRPIKYRTIGGKIRTRVAASQQYACDAALRHKVLGVDKRKRETCDATYVIVQRRLDSTDPDLTEGRTG